MALSKPSRFLASGTAQKHVFHRNTCRLCDSSKLDPVLKLTPTPLPDAYISKNRIHEAQDVFPLDVFLCRECGHVQLLDVVDPQLLFGHYLYETSSSTGLVEHFRRYVSEVCQSIKPPANSLAIDIGSNDGTLLSFLKQQGLNVFGVDPAEEIAQKATQSGIRTIPAFFTSVLARTIRKEHGPASIICANNVFAHSDNLGDMASGISHLLAQDGVFVFEVSYLLDMIEGLVFDFIYQEHLCYHSVKPLQRFLKKHGMELIDIKHVPSKGGSIRVFAQPLGGPRKISSTVNEIIKTEANVGLDRPEIFQAYSLKIENLRLQFLNLIQELTKQGKKIAGYGASATVTILTYHFNLGNVLKFLVDDNPARQNLYSPGYHIPVLAPNAIYEQKPDYVVILAWRFAEMILKRHKKFSDEGGCFIIPLPKLRTA